MSEQFNAPMTPDRRSLSPRDWAWIVTALYALSLVTAITHIPGVIVAYIKMPDVRGTLYESHFTYAIRSFWIGMALLVAGVALCLVGVGIVILSLMGVWWLIRIIRPVIALMEDRPINDPYGFF